MHQKLFTVRLSESWKLIEILQRTHYLTCAVHESDHMAHFRKTVMVNAYSFQYSQQHQNFAGGDLWIRASTMGPPCAIPKLKYVNVRHFASISENMWPAAVTSVITLMHCIVENGGVHIEQSWLSWMVHLLTFVDNIHDALSSSGSCSLCFNFHCHMPICLLDSIH